MQHLPEQPMPRNRDELVEHLTSVNGHGIMFIHGFPKGRDDAMWEHLEAHSGPGANHRHDWSGRAAHEQPVRAS